MAASKAIQSPAETPAKSHHSIRSQSPFENNVDWYLKAKAEHCENVEPKQRPYATHTHPEHVDVLSPEHREYLMQRHGTLELDPIPSIGDADPYNWSTWKKTMNLALVAIHACLSTFTAAAIIPAFELIAEDLGRSLQDISYLVSLQIAVLGVAPLFWKPLSNRYGRRPVFLLSLICSSVGNIGCAKSPSYESMSVCRAIVAFFISPAAAIGSVVVTETFFKKERARYMGIWTLMVTLGVPLSPFIFGFVANHAGYRWIYWVLAIFNGIQFVLYIFFGPETRYIRNGVPRYASDSKQEYLTFGRIDPQPFSMWEFIQPLFLFRKICIAVPAAAYAMVFLFGSVLIAVELPHLFAQKFHFNAQQLGLQFLGIIIGSIIGEQLGGILSDTWMSRRARKIGGRPNPEFRLWLSYSGYLLAICGLVVFLVRTEQAPNLQWNVTPVIGIAIAGAGNQIVTTVLITYAVDCHPEESASIGVFVTFVRQIWGFIGPFWFPAMFENVGVAASAGVVTALIVGVSILPTMLVQWRGPPFRKRNNEDVAAPPKTNVSEA
ncbi:Uncharacterized protein BP5553_10676 [Venustampulla echinocandica]|uniref:Major facilitator superfamily (MFS) profile domain-containing protein n=1 Tax=Venustampulla echinocandica TaxID=2656787 RepID=A0A370T8Q8_9HELO|nr:Uncharacterized protein BP5553_10676 [Venustampulla echinocandica]RDL29811.1 Uncharacterized protein BP5553_10676 [Venustampulla echinocandica]